MGCPRLCRRESPGLFAAACPRVPTANLESRAFTWPATSSRDCSTPPRPAPAGPAQQLGPRPSNPAAFKPSWWKGSGEGDNNCGTVAYEHPLPCAHAPDGWCDAGWYHLLQGASHYLEGLPERPGVILRAIPDLDVVRDNAFCSRPAWAKAH